MRELRPASEPYRRFIDALCSSASSVAERHKLDESQLTEWFWFMVIKTIQRARISTEEGRYALNAHMLHSAVVTRVRGGVYDGDLQADLDFGAAARKAAGGTETAWAPHDPSKDTTFEEGDADRFSAGYFFHEQEDEPTPDDVRLDYPPNIDSLRVKWNLPAKYTRQELVDKCEIRCLRFPETLVPQVHSEFKELEPYAVED